jgi:hypothetical protein
MAVYGTCGTVFYTSIAFITHFNTLNFIDNSSFGRFKGGIRKKLHPIIDIGATIFDIKNRVLAVSTYAKAIENVFDRQFAFPIENNPETLFLKVLE